MVADQVSWMQVLTNAAEHSSFASPILVLTGGTCRLFSWDDLWDWEGSRSAKVAGSEPRWGLVGLRDLHLALRIVVSSGFDWTRYRLMDAPPTPTQAINQIGL